MLVIREADIRDFNRFYSAVMTDFDRRELLPKQGVRRAIRRGDAEFLLFCDEESGLPLGYALCGIRNVYDYVLIKYFGIFSWYRDQGYGVAAMRLLQKRYAERQGLMAELTVFEDSEDGDYLKKLRRFFRRFGFEEEKAPFRLGGAKVTFMVKGLKGTSEVGPVAGRLLLDFYSRVLRPAELEKMLKAAEE